MSLEEDLARRLASIQWPGLRTTPENVANMEIDAAQGNGATWGDIAREVIRQMEWARQNAMREFVSDDAREVRADLNRLPLTLAPEDWKP